MQLHLAQHGVPLGKGGGDCGHRAAQGTDAAGMACLQLPLTQLRGSAPREPRPPCSLCPPKLLPCVGPLPDRPWTHSLIEPGLQG